MEQQDDKEQDLKEQEDKEQVSTENDGKEYRTSLRRILRSKKTRINTTKAEDNKEQNDNVETFSIKLYHLILCS